MLHLCEVSDPSVLDINKDVYDGELMLIDGIPKEVAPTLEKPMTPAKDCNADNVKVKDEGNVGPSGQSFRFICKTFWCIFFFCNHYCWSSAYINKNFPLKNSCQDF